jgi:hypothetical protein
MDLGTEGTAFWESGQSNLDGRTIIGIQIELLKSGFFMISYGRSAASSTLLVDHDVYLLGY